MTLKLSFFTHETCLQKICIKDEILDFKGDKVMRKPLWLFIAFVLGLALFLAACSGGSQETEGPDTDPNESSEQPKETDNGDEEDEETPEEPSGPKPGGELVTSLGGNPTLFNPFYSNDTASSDIEGRIFIGLLGSDPELNTTPEDGLAESIEESEDGLVYRIKLREGIKFHDGEPLTADDVVFTYNIPLHDDYDGPRKSTFANLEKVEKVDDLTVEFHMKKVDMNFRNVGLTYGILPEHILGDVPIAELGDHEFNRKNPIGAGPYKFVEWVDGQYVTLEKFDDFVLGTPYIERITFKIITDANARLAQLQNRDIDFHQAVPPTDIDAIRADLEAAGLKIEEGLGLSYTFFGYNLRNELFQDKKVRQALTHAINREEIVERIMYGHGEVAHVPESPLSWAYNPDVPKFEYDVEKAKQLLAEAGWEPGSDGILEKDGKKFSFEIKTNQGNKVREDIAVYLQEHLKEVGIEAKPRITEWSALIQEINPPNWDFDAIILGWSLGIDPDPSGIFHTNEIEKGLNMIAYSNPELDKLMEAQLEEQDKNKRKEMIGEIQALLAEDQPYTFLYYPIEFRAMPAELQGYVFHGKNPYYKIHEWWLDSE